MTMRGIMLWRPCAAIMGLLFALVSYGCVTVQADTKVKDSFQQKFDFSRIGSIIILPFYENYRSATDSFVPVSSTSDVHESVDVISMELFEAGIKVVDRMFLQKVLDEHKLSLSGLMEEQDYKKLGKLVNADAILWGAVNTTKLIGKRGCKISIRLIDVETGTVIYTAVAEKSDIWGGLDASSFKTDLLAESGKKLKEFLMKSR